MKRKLSILAALFPLCAMVGCPQQPVTPPVITYTFGSSASWGGPSPSSHANAMDLGEVSATVSSVATCEIPSYSSSVLMIHTTCQGNYYDATNGVEQFYNYDGSWHPGTSQAITDILLSVAGETFAVGSTVTLYGEQ